MWPGRAGSWSASRASFARMTDSGLAAFYRRYNEHRVEDLKQFVARDVVINGIDHGVHEYAKGCESSSALSPITTGSCATCWSIRRGSPRPWRTRERTVGPSAASPRPAAR